MIGPDMDVRAGAVRAQLDMYVKEIGVPQTPTPFGARFLPVRSLSKESGDHPINMRLGVNTKEKRQLPPARVWIETSQIKDMVYESLMRDRRAPEGRERENMWPLDADLRGYGPSYAKQLASTPPRRRWWSCIPHRCRTGWPPCSTARYVVAYSTGRVPP